MMNSQPLTEAMMILSNISSSTDQQYTYYYDISSERRIIILYFEPYKKTYYRFPSARTINDLDEMNYFPERPVHEDNTLRVDNHINHHTERQTYYDL